MVQSDLKKRKIPTWYNIVQDRAEWRKVVSGEAAGKQRKKVAEEKHDNNEDARLVCHKCGKRYMSRRGGWYELHVATCGMKGGGVGGREVMVCPKCGKVYHAKRWFNGHVTNCGSGQI